MRGTVLRGFSSCMLINLCLPVMIRAANRCVVRTGPHYLLVGGGGNPKTIHIVVRPNGISGQAVLLTSVITLERFRMDARLPVSARTATAFCAVLATPRMCKHFIIPSGFRQLSGRKDALGLLEMRSIQHLAVERNRAAPGT